MADIFTINRLYMRKLQRKEGILMKQMRGKGRKEIKEKRRTHGREKNSGKV